MTGSGAGRQGPLPLREFDEFVGRTVDVSLTIEDVVLLVLNAGDRPVKGLGRLTGEVLLALRGVLGGPDVETAAFEKGPGGPRSEDVEFALDNLAFSNSVKMTGDGGDPAAVRFEIAPRGRTRIREKWDALPVDSRRKLAQGRAKWDEAEPLTMDEPLYIHNETLLKGGRQAAPSGGQYGRWTAEQAPTRSGVDAARRQVYVDGGDKLFKEGQYKEAHAAYKTAAGLGAPSVDLYFRMARSLAEMGRHKDALKHCRAATRVDPTDASGYIAMAYCLYKLGRYAKALPHSSRAVLQGPYIPQAYMVRGAILNRLGRHTEAMSHYQRAIRLDPANIEARQSMSDLLLQLGRDEEALPHAEQLAKLAPKNPAAHARVVACLSKLGRHEDAVSAACKSVEAAPDSIDSYLPITTALFALRSHEEVIKWSDRAMAVDSGDSRPHFITALSLRELGRQEEALAHCRRAVDLGASSTDFHLLMSYLLRDLGRFAEALPHCEAVVAAKPRDQPALSNMGGILVDLGRHEEALACFDEALQIDPNQPVPRYNRALSLQSTGRLRRALGEYRKVVSLDPGSTGAYNNMGTVLAKLGRDCEALAHFDRALGIDPGNAAAHYNKALSLLRLNLISEALAHFDRALELSPGNSDAYVGRISCLDELKLADKPIGHYAGEELGTAAAQGAATSTGAGKHASAASITPATEAATSRVDRRYAPAPGPARGGDRARLVESLLSKNESKVLEFKTWPAPHLEGSARSKKISEKIAIVLCSFLNTDGGHLLIGVDDDGKVVGVTPGADKMTHKQKDDALRRLTDIIVEYLGADCYGYFDYNIVEIRGHDVLHCAASMSQDGPVTLKKELEGKHEFFVRVGSTCRAHGPREMLMYINKKWPTLNPSPRPIGRATDDRKSETDNAMKSRSVDLLTDEPERHLGGGGWLP